MNALNGKLLRYQYENGDEYQILFAENKATWTYAPDTEKAATGIENHDAIEVAPNVYFVSWLEANGEVVSLVANLNDNIIHASYVHENSRHFWQGRIKYFGEPK